MALRVAGTNQIDSGYRIRLPRELIIFTAIASLIALASPNPVETLFAVVLLPLFFWLLWRPGEMPVLLLALGYQWLQVATPVISANFIGLKLGDHVALPNLDIAAMLGLVALLFLALGVRIGRGPAQPELVEQANLEVRALSVHKLLLAYLVGHLVGFATSGISSTVGGLAQPLSALDQIRWIFVFCIFWIGFTQPKFRGLALTVGLFELAIGFLGFFSGFKQILFVAIVISIAVFPNPRSFIRPSAIAIAGLMLTLLVFWQAVKVDYRDFLNQGTRSQDVLVPVSERLMFLFERTLKLAPGDLLDGLQAGVDRSGYLEYFGRSIEMTPEYIPYQDGRLWLEALRHPITPRLLFPDKPVISDSVRVNEFSGIRVAGADQGASISLGYVAESYIDFGPVVMFLPIFALGIFWGWAYRTLSQSSRSSLLSLAFATMFILTQAIYYESSNIKLVGGGLSFFLGAFLLLKFFAPFLWKMIRAKRSNQKASFKRASSNFQ